MYLKQFEYFMNEYRLPKFTLNGKTSFFLYDLELSFHEHAKYPHVTVKGFIPYLLLKHLPEVNPTPEQHLDYNNLSYTSALEVWASSSLCADYLISHLTEWENDKDLSAAALIQLIRQKKAELMAEHPEDFYLTTCHFFTLEGLVTFLRTATASVS